VGYLEQRQSTIQKGFGKALSLLDPGRWPHLEIPSRQLLWILMLVCFQLMGSYWMRHVRPNLTKEFAEGIGYGIFDLLRMTTGMNTNDWTVTGKMRLRLPIRDRGCGLREAADWKHAQFVGGMAQSTPTWCCDGRVPP